MRNRLVTEEKIVDVYAIRHFLFFFFCKYTFHHSGSKKEQEEENKIYKYLRDLAIV